MQDIDESPWDDSPSGGMAHAAEAEWTRLSSGFQNAGYREGITAGKEAALQEGFDTGFAQTGGPVGRELGLLRGLASALLLHLSRSRSRTRTQTHHQRNDEEPHAEPGEPRASANVREILDALAAVRFADIAIAAPVLCDEEGHAHHCGGVEDEDLKSARDGDDGGREEEREREEAYPSPKSAAGRGSVVTTIEDVRALRVKLETLLCESGLNIDLNLEIF